MTYKVMLAAIVVGGSSIFAGCGGDVNAEEEPINLLKMAKVTDDGRSFQNPTLFDACVNDDLPDVNRHLSRGANVNAASKKNDFKLRPLHAAARRGNDQIAALLLASGAEVDIMASNQATPLSFAADAGRLSVAKLLLAKGAKIDAMTTEGITPVMAAVRSSHVDVVEYLLAKGADPNVRNAFGASALDSISELVKDDARALRIAGLLLKNGATVNLQDNEGLTALHGAVNHGRLPLAKLLLESGADVNISAKNFDTPLRAALVRGNLDLITLLTKHGASLDAPFKDGGTPLEAAIVAAVRAPGDFTMYDHLVKLGADVNKPNADGVSAKKMRADVEAMAAELGKQASK